MTAALRKTADGLGEEAGATIDRARTLHDEEAPTAFPPARGLVRRLALVALDLVDLLTEGNQ